MWGPLRLAPFHTDPLIWIEYGFDPDEYIYIYTDMLSVLLIHVGLAQARPFSHGSLNRDSRSGPNMGSTQMCVHTAIIAWCQYAGNPVVEKTAFNEALLLFIFFWLRWRRLRLARARIRRIPAAQSIELAIVVAQWRLTSHIAISAALRLLQGNWLKRRVWAKPRSASLYQDIVRFWSEFSCKSH